MAQFTKPMTMLRPKIVHVDAVGVTRAAPTSSIPRSIETPAPRRGVKYPHRTEKPVQVGTQDLQGRPFSEPENVPTLEPVSRL
jgi:hypothetical protein